MADAGPLLDALLRDLEDRPLAIRRLFEQGGPGGPGGHGEAPVVVVLHQDRKSSDQNADFKNELGRLAATSDARGQRKDRLRIVALADVGGYDFWPARRYVLDALKPLRAEGGALVLADWKGSVRKSYGLRSGESAVFVLAPSRELRILKRGVLGKDEAAQLLHAIEALIPR